MNVIKLFFLMALFFSPISLNGYEKDFFVLTIPKSGSHLILKMLRMVTEKHHVLPSQTFPQRNAYQFPDEDNCVIDQKEIEEAFLFWKDSHHFPLAHFNFSENFFLFSQNHPEYVKIILIRDLRDACVSCAIFQSDTIEQEIGPCSLKEKILFIINLGKKTTTNKFLRIEENARHVLPWLSDPETVVCRFENLVGEKGGGSLAAQMQQIVDICLKLEIYVPIEKLESILATLFGVDEGPIFPSTFREGKIGGWRNYFDEEINEAFNGQLGELQLKLGYSLD